MAKKLIPNKELITKWVKALRSGRYKQGNDELHNKKTNTFCCLGVLCKAARLPHVVEDDNRVFYFIEEGGKQGSEDEGSKFILPNIFRNKIGISTKIQNKLINMNDEKGATFKDIADFIERYYLND